MVKKSDKKINERGLGRGLSALMSDISVPNIVEDNKQDNQGVIKPTASQTFMPSYSETPQSNGATYVSIDQLERNPDQPRKFFDAEKLNELTQSIRDKGCLLYTSPSPRDATLSRMPSSA